MANLYVSMQALAEAFTLSTRHNAIKVVSSGKASVTDCALRPGMIRYPGGVSLLKKALRQQAGCLPGPSLVR